MMLRERNPDRRVVEGRHEVRDAFPVASADQAVRILRRDFPHVPEDFAAAVRPRFEAIGERRDFVVAFAEKGLVGQGVVDAVQEVFPQDDVVRVGGGLVVPVPVRLVEVVVGDCACRHDDVNEAELHHVAHHFLQASRREGARAAEEHRALRVRHHVLQDGGAEAQGPRLKGDMLVAVDEVRDRLRLLEVEVFDRDGGKIGLRGLLVGHARRYAAPGQKGSVGSRLLAAFDRLGDRARLLLRPRADRVLVSVEEHIQVRILPLDLLDSLHDVLEGDRLVVRVDPHDDPLLALRPQGRPPSALVETIRFVRPYKYYSGPARSLRTPAFSGTGQDCSMILRRLRLNTLLPRSESQPVLPGRSCSRCSGRHRPDGGEARGGRRRAGLPRVRRRSESARRVRGLRHEAIGSAEGGRQRRRPLAQSRVGWRPECLDRCLGGRRGFAGRSTPQVARRRGYRVSGMDRRPDDHGRREDPSDGRGARVRRQGARDADESPRGRRPPRRTRGDARHVEPRTRELPAGQVRSDQVHRGDRDSFETAPDGDREAPGVGTGHRAHQEGFDCGHQVCQDAAAQGRRLAGSQEAPRAGGEGSPGTRGRGRRAALRERAPPQAARSRPRKAEAGPARTEEARAGPRGARGRVQGETGGPRFHVGGESGAPSEELKRRFEEELREMEQDYLAKEEEFKKRIIGLEEAVGKYKIEDKVRAEAKAFEGKPKGEVQAAFSRKEQEVLHKEKMVLLREQELQRLQEDLQVKEDEIKKVKEPLTYKEEELLRREEDLLYREKVLQAEHRKVEEAKAQGGSVEELDLKSRLEELKSTITAKEEEVRTKERYLQQKMEDLRLREQGLISEDIEARDKDLQVEVKQQKVKMGIPRLDDLLFGGIPFGTNASVYGPAYVGKEVLASLL